MLLRSIKPPNARFCEAMNLTEYKEAKRELNRCRRELIDYIRRTLHKREFGIEVIQEIPSFGFIKTVKRSRINNWSVTAQSFQKTELENLMRVLEGSSDLVRTINNIVFYKNIKNTHGLSFFKKVDDSIVEVLKELLGSDLNETLMADGLKKRNICPGKRRT